MKFVSKTCFAFLFFMLPLGMWGFVLTANADTVQIPTPTPLQESTSNLPIIKGSAIEGGALRQVLFAPAFSTSSVSDSETFTIPSDGTVAKSTPLKNGVQYAITISGTFIWGGCDPIHCPNGGPDYKRYGDAGYLTDDHWASFADPFWSYFIYLEINGSHFMPDTYSSDHVYSLNLTGNGNPQCLESTIVLIAILIIQGI